MDLNIRNVIAYQVGDIEDYHDALTSTRLERLQKVMQQRFVDPFPTNQESSSSSPPSAAWLRESSPPLLLAVPNDTMPSEHDLWAWSHLAVLAQRSRERRAMGQALHEVCLKAYGREWVPSWKAVGQAMMVSKFTANGELLLP